MELPRVGLLKGLKGARLAGELVEDTVAFGAPESKLRVSSLLFGVWNQMTQKRACPILAIALCAHT